MPPPSSTILYYPTIQVPSRNWLRHALLYWDQVSSIVPAAIELPELSPDIRYLMEEGQFTPVQPEMLVHTPSQQNYLQAFEKEMMQVVQTERFQRLQQVNQTPFTIHRRKMPHRKYQNEQFPYRIHMDKVSYQLYDFLLENGLVSPQEIDGWYYFDRTAALVYMSLLAKYLAEIAAGHTTIGTDLAAYENLNFDPVTRSATFPVVSVNLDGLLPMPQENVALQDIIAFKRKRKDNLLHFRSVLLEFHQKVGKASSHAEYKDLSMNFSLTLTNGVEDLSQVLKESKIESRWKALKSLVSIKHAPVITGLVAAADEIGQYSKIPLALKIAGLTVLGAIELKTQYVETRNKLAIKERESAFSYVLAAKRRGIIHRLPA